PGAVDAKVNLELALRKLSSGAGGGWAAGGFADKTPAGVMARARDWRGPKATCPQGKAGAKRSPAKPDRALFSRGKKREGAPKFFSF
ncbi:MAG: hypothetical protein LBC67_06920, partial [Spirochaetales bacterium]|nr:hypothetical protein [Spirochaetales bacterium]